MEKPDQASAAPPEIVPLPEKTAPHRHRSRTGQFLQRFCFRYCRSTHSHIAGDGAAAGPVALGLIEGVADAVASLLKLWSGGIRTS